MGAVLAAALAGCGGDDGSGGGGALAATVRSVALAVLAGHAVSRYRFAGRGTFMTTVLSTQMFPGVAVYVFMTAWGEVLFASVLTDASTRTLAVGLRTYASQSNVYWNQIMAASLVVGAPVVVGFLALQRFLVQGLTAGAVKS